MIKVIVSHDVDHLFAGDHWFRDLIYPKLWVRTTLQLVKREITGREWFLRIAGCFRKNRHNLEPLMSFDEAHGIPSTFFFGMNQGLGMSYRPEEAKPVIEAVHRRGFSARVHGIDYQTKEGMKREYETFRKTAGFDPCGIRMHYVRFDSSTFEKLSEIGYPFDTTEFDKQGNGTRKAPYPVGNMWEFPLSIMDVYLPQKLEQAKQKTLELLEECKAKDLQYITVLFHDYQFCDDYRDMRDWYVWLTEYFAGSPDYEFASYEEAIRDMNGKQET